MRRRAQLAFGTSALALAIVACSDRDAASDSNPTRPVVDLGGGGYVDGGEPDANKARVDGGFVGADGGVDRSDRFVTTIVSFAPGDCSGFGASRMPEVVLGPPVGFGAWQGSLDVVSLGHEGEIVLSFAPNAIVDGPGVDFVVFENAFYAGGDSSSPAADLGEVSVSEDGQTWVTFACEPGDDAPYGACAGWRPVYSAPGNGISAFDVERAGGDAYDLAAVGLAHARFVRIRDLGRSECPSGPSKPNNMGFDLDAIAVVNSEIAP